MVALLPLASPSLARHPRRRRWLLAVAWALAVGGVVHALIMDARRVASLAGWHRIRYPSSDEYPDGRGLLTVKAEHRDLLESLRPARGVVVVDDHPSFRRCARRLLTLEGFEVVGEAAGGEEAIALVSELDPELVLLDVQLPDIDGFEVAARLLARDPALAIVLVSSRDRSQYGFLVEASGARGFVAKGELSGPALARVLE